MPRAASGAGVRAGPAPAWWYFGVAGGGAIAGAATAPPLPGLPCRPRDLHEHRAGFTLIRGVPGPAQEVELDPGDLAALLARLRTYADLVLVDVGAALSPREFGDVHRAALRAADLILVVGALTEVGLHMPDLFLPKRKAYRLRLPVPYPSDLSLADSL